MNRLFRDYLRGPARQADALYILGDLFEAWIGDDDHNAFNEEIVAELAAASAAGLAISLLHGNRDFLLGADFAQRSGCTLLPDPYVLSLPTWQFVLSHGDALCTEDGDYQAFRAEVRRPEWQAAFLGRSLAERQQIAGRMRDVSIMGKQQKSMASMDLNPAATDDFLREHGYATFIHGHTHQPARHDHIVDGIHVERWVLADWHEDQGEFLSWDGEQLQRQLLR
ncbi:MAG: hypothetical protein RIR00_1439 [Pseudomonadota bacterium]